MELRLAALRGISAALVVAAAALSWSGAARADLREVVARAGEQWRSSGATVSQAPTRFLFEGDTLSIRVPPAPGARCTTVGFIGARGISFHAYFGSEGDSGSDLVGKSTSVAGLLELVRCAGGPVDRVVLVGDAGRGAVEVVVARSKAPLPSLRTIFPERTGGVLPPTQEPGLVPQAPPVAKRVNVAEARARADGGAVGARASWESTEDGSGSGEIELAAGCHRVELFASEPTVSFSPGNLKRAGRDKQEAILGRRLRFDLDAELRDSDDNRLMARDRTDTPDVRLDACVGAPTQADVLFVGAAPRSRVLMTRATWPIPEGIPRIWGTGPRAKMAGALLARRLNTKDSTPVFVTQGASGTTPIPVALEPGACYVAVVAVVDGSARGLGLRAIVGGNESTDERGHNDNSGVVAFCTHEQRHGRLEVEARGTRMSWGLALYRVDSGAWELTP